MTRRRTKPQRPNVKNAILDAGIDAFLRQGYAAASVGDIVERAGVPKGSFYYYFESKGALASAAVQRYAGLDRELRDMLLDGAGTPLARLRDYFASYVAAFESKQFRDGCLFGILGLELGDSNMEVTEDVRAEVDRWTAVIAKVIESAMASGQIAPRHSSAALARAIVNAWEGALFRMRLEKSVAPLHEFQTIVFDSLLRPA